MDFNASSSSSSRGTCDENERIKNLMRQHLPMAKTYSTRKEGRLAAQFVSVAAGGQGIRGDNNVSWGKCLTMRCESMFKPPPNSNKKGATCLCSDPKHESEFLGDDFECERKEGEGERAYKSRFLQAKIDYGEEKGHCSFLAVLKCVKCGEFEEWKFQTMKNDLNYLPHSATCLHNGKLRGGNVVKVMKKAISSNKESSGKKVIDMMVDKSHIGRGNLPSGSTLYRAQGKVKNEAFKWYDKNYERLEDYLIELKKENPSFRVTIVKDNENRFLRLFIGIGTSMQILKHAGLDVYGIDSCHFKHDVVKGMQIHLLVSNQGAWQNVILAMSIDINESCESYCFFASECKEMGIVRDLFTARQGCIPTKPVLFSDGMKGVLQVIETWSNGNVHHALCARHLLNSLRAWLKCRKKNCTVNVMKWYAMIRASTEEDFVKNYNALLQTNGDIELYLQNIKKEQYSQSHMLNLPTPVGCRSWITSNLVEGANGSIVEERNLDPYNFVHEMMTSAATKLSKQIKTVNDLVKAGCRISDKALELVRKEKRLIRERSYGVKPINDPKHFLVSDNTSTSRRSHQVCIDPKHPSCTLCDTFYQWGIPCRHILSAIMHDDESMHLLQPESRGLFYKSFFHPGYLVSNLQLAYKDCKIILPSAPVGEPIELITINEENKLEEKSVDRQEERMQPPANFTLENYSTKKHPGRPRNKRIRSRGDTESGGGSRLRQRPKVRQGRSGAGKANIALLDVLF